MYVEIEQLNKGDLVKTLYDGYLPIQNISMGTFVLGRDIDMGMYKKKKEGSMIADLEMTGLHSILVKENDQKYEKDIENQIKNTHYGKIYCDGFFRLNANYSSDFVKMPVQCYTIYTFSLHGEKNQYGIWANGLLVETTANEIVLSKNMNTK